MLDFATETVFWKRKILMKNYKMKEQFLLIRI